MKDSKATNKTRVRRRGRPTKFTKKMGDLICSEIADGKSLRTVCSKDNMPDKSTVFRWLRLPSFNAFRDQYARACEARADAFAEDMLYIASTPEVGQIVTVKNAPDGLETTTKTEDMLGHRRLLVDTLKWNMARMKPKKYGDKIDITSDGDKIEPVRLFPMRPGDLAKRVNPSSADDK